MKRIHRHGKTEIKEEDGEDRLIVSRNMQVRLNLDAREGLGCLIVALSGDRMLHLSTGFLK